MSLKLSKNFPLIQLSYFFFRVLDDNAWKNIVEMREPGTKLKLIQLYKPEGSIFGFKLDTCYETRTLFATGIHKEGISKNQILEGDHILAVNGKPFNIAYQKAVEILRNIKGEVEFIISRRCKCEIKDNNKHCAMM